MTATRISLRLRRKILLVLLVSTWDRRRHAAHGFAASSFVTYRGKPSFSPILSPNTRPAAASFATAVAAARSRSHRSATALRAGVNEDDYRRLAQRLARLERIVDEKNAEVEEMRSSMEHMRMIVQIQAQIDSCLVDDEYGADDEEGCLLSSGAGSGGTRGGLQEPDSRLLKQAINLLRLRHRVLQAWEFDGELGDSPLPSDRGHPTHASDARHQKTNDEGSDRRRRTCTDSTRGSPSGGGDAGDGAAQRRSRSRRRTRDGRFFDADGDRDGEFLESGSIFDGFHVPSERGDGTDGYGGSGENAGLHEPRVENQRPPKTNQDAAEAAGVGVVAALMEGRRRLIVEVDDPQLRLNSPEFCHEAMAEFVELLFLPLTTALENLKARQNRCKVVIQGAHNVEQVEEAMVLDAPNSLHVVALEDAKVCVADRVVALVSPENWKGKKGKHLRRVLNEAHDAAIVLINPTGTDKFLRPADYNTFERVYHLRPMRVDYLQPLPPPQQHPSFEYDDWLEDEDSGWGGGRAGQLEPTGEALLLERLGESVWAEETALAAAAAAAAAAIGTGTTAEPEEASEEGVEAVPAAAAIATTTVPDAGLGDNDDGQGGGDDTVSLAADSHVCNPSESAHNAPLSDGTPPEDGLRAAAAEVGVTPEERALRRAALDMSTGGSSLEEREEGWGSPEVGYRDSDWRDIEGERLSEELAAAALAAWSEEDLEAGGPGRAGVVEKEARWSEGEVGEGEVGADEAAEMSALAVTLRQFPDAWKAFVDLHDGMGFRLCGTWDMEPPQTAVQTMVMDHILRIVMD